ncbi:uracil-DNA glycosylase [Altererythrobacter sp. H2]|uniref:uracil-DNA glycosylase n=1 Tax=Altererythrobacter sp. H2 TaxID=3108391 RepID=UPI002B4BFD35|nr:uracil-DNA glycosylase [Altererythrobacter sp. H2]WRK96926.1 uracil-DNA glycosylase [Altererythrobacter sp. H2]
MVLQMPLADSEPPHDCPLCPRLVALRRELEQEYPDWWNAPVPAWGDPAGWLAMVGLAPGKHGANRTGRPFTGDYAGDLLFATLAKFGFTRGSYESRVDDGFSLQGAIIINSVKCLPPQNKPTPAEIATCRRFLSRQVEELPQVRVYVALGRIAHDSFLTTQGLRKAAYPFGHAAQHELPDGRWLIDSYHCSRYNTQTGRLTAEMFEQVFEHALARRQMSSAIRP